MRRASIWRHCWCTYLSQHTYRGYVLWLTRTAKKNSIFWQNTWIAVSHPFTTLATATSEVNVTTLNLCIWCPSIPHPVWIRTRLLYGPCRFPVNGENGLSWILTEEQTRITQSHRHYLGQDLKNADYTCTCTRKQRDSVNSSFRTLVCVHANMLTASHIH
jgi:hypothetical protein